jgi:putative ABC transport system permease protein
VFAVPYLQLAGFFVLAGVAGIVASIVPAWRASRLDILDAIAHE